MKFKLALASILVAAGLAAPASAHSPYPPPHHGGFGGPQWEFLGAREVSHFSERDRIHARGYHKYSQVRICVYNRAVRMQDVDVVFRNGGHQDLQVRRFLRPGECTRAIDLAGYRRDIRFLDLFYQTAGRNYGPKAVVRVFAR